MWHAEGFLGERGKVLIDLYFLYACILAMILLKNHHLKKCLSKAKKQKNSVWHFQTLIVIFIN